MLDAAGASDAFDGALLALVLEDELDFDFEPDLVLALDFDFDLGLDFGGGCSGSRP